MARCNNICHCDVEITDERSKPIRKEPADLPIIAKGGLKFEQNHSGCSYERRLDGASFPIRCG
jgi:hypothetical protein